MKTDKQIKILKELLEATRELQEHQNGWGKDLENGEKFLKYLIKEQDKNNGSII
jgi:hypothetical protein